MKFIHFIDENRVLFIRKYFKNKILDFIMFIVSFLGNLGLIWVFIDIYVFFFAKNKPLGIAIFISLIVNAIVVNAVLKPHFSRIRPYEKLKFDIKIKKPTDYSFPSGHTAASFAVVGSLYVFNSNLFIPSLILSLLMGFSRMYLGVHYFSDVFAGGLIGYIIGFIVGNIII